MCMGRCLNCNWWIWCGSGSSSWPIYWITEKLLKKLWFFWSKIAIYLHLGLHKTAKPLGEVFSPQKRTSSISKHQNFFTFLNFVGSFSPSWIRVQQLKLTRIRITEPLDLTGFSQNLPCITYWMHISHVSLEFRNVLDSVFLHHLKNHKLICPISKFPALSHDGPFRGRGMFVRWCEGGGGVVSLYHI